MKGQNQHSNKPRSTSGLSSTPSPTPTGRGNGHRRSNSRYGNSGGSSSNGKSPDEKVLQTRLTALISKAMGKKVIATVSNGARYYGLLVSADTAASGAFSGMSVVLYKPVLLRNSSLNDKSNVDSALPEKLIVKLSELVDIEVLKLDIMDPVRSSGTAASVPSTSDNTQSTPSKFKTDTDISKTAFRERELQKWVPEDHEVLMNPDLVLEDASSSGWDQFKVNQDKFGVDSTFDEHLYTTRINVQAPDYQARVARATKIAKEIESLLTSDRHILEERGIAVDDSGMDEEDKYSGVDRRGDELMAALRGPLGNVAQYSVGNTESKTQDLQKYNPHEKRAARYHNDPAIVLSSATGGSLKQSSTAAPASTSADPVSTTADPVSTTSAPISATTAPVSETAAPVLQSNSQATKSSSASTATTTTTSTLKNKPTSIPPKPPVTQSTEQFRLNAQSEINSLREFSATFKIPHKMPNDLLPILAKDHKKQEEIIKKQHDVSQPQPLTKDAKSSKDTKPIADAATSPSSSVATTASSSTSTSTTPHLTRKKLETTKSAFNPKAASFTPGSFTSSGASKHPLLSPIAQKSSYHRGSNTNPSPRVNHQRPYSSQGGPGTAGSGSSSKRLHHVSAAEFFGSPSKVPTKEGQEEKLKLLRDLFCLFATTRRRFAEEKKEGHITYDRTYQTPPTWDFTVDLTHDQVYPNPDSIPKQVPGMMIPESSPFMPSPLLNGPSAMSPAMSGSCGGNPNSKLPISAHQQQLAAASMAAFHQLQQQQQFQAAMIYQHQLAAAAAAAGGVPPGQPPMPMYPGSDPFLPPGAPTGFMAPPGNFIGSGSGSPVSNHMMIGGNIGQGSVPGSNPGGPGYQGGNYGHHGGRRYNNNAGGNSGNKRNN